MISTLNKVTALIDTYDSLTVPDGKTLSGILKELSSQLFYLEKFRSDYHKQFNGIVFMSTKNKAMTVARAIVKANEEVPELYMLRHIMKGAYGVVGALTMNISTINKEK